MQASASAGESPAQLEGRVALARSSGRKTNTPRRPARHIAGEDGSGTSRCSLSLRGIGSSATVISSVVCIAHDNYAPAQMAASYGRVKRDSDLLSHGPQGIVTALAARGCAMSCATFLNENFELGPRSRRGFGRGEMIASMSRGADTFMYASGDESAMARSASCEKRPTVTWLGELR